MSGNPEVDRLLPNTPRAENLAIVPMAAAGAIWGLTFVLAGVPEVAVYPWAYAALAAVNLWAYRRHARRWALDLQLALSLIVPWLLMLDLGGFRASGAVVLWSLIAPLGALLTYGVRTAAWWFGAYAALSLIAALLERRLEPTDLGDGWVAAYFFANTIGVTAVAWWVTGQYATPEVARIEVWHHSVDSLGESRPRSFDVRVAPGDDVSAAIGRHTLCVEGPSSCRWQ